MYIHASIGIMHVCVYVYIYIYIHMFPACFESDLGLFWREEVTGLHMCMYNYMVVYIYIYI